MSMALLFETYGDRAAEVLVGLRTTGEVPEERRVVRVAERSAERRVTGPQAVASMASLLGAPVMPDA